MPSDLREQDGFGERLLDKENAFFENPTVAQHGLRVARHVHRALHVRHYHGDLSQIVGILNDEQRF